MALYGHERDISFFNHINRELLERIIETKCGYYKISLETTKTNIYGESTEKIFSEPVLLNCLVNRREQDGKDDDFGSDRLRNVSFAFYRRHLTDINLVPEGGDIIEWNGDFYEVDNWIENQLIVGKQPEYPYDQSYLSQFGASWSIILNTHWTREDKLEIRRSR